MGRLVLGLCSAVAAPLALELAYRFLIDPHETGLRMRPLALSQPIVVDPIPFSDGGTGPACITFHRDVAARLVRALPQSPSSRR